MVEFRTFMSIALDKCAPSGEGTGEARQRVFSTFVTEWNRNEEQIREMNESEVRNAIECQ